MMRSATIALAFLAAALLASPNARAQAPVPPTGPEFEKLKNLVGTWEATIKTPDGSESKGTAVYRMGVGGRWLVGEFKSEFGGMPFEGKSLDSYNPATKKYVSVWVDSMAAVPIVSHGEYDKDGKVLTMAGEETGPDGKTMKMKFITEMKGKDAMAFKITSPGEGGKDLTFMTIDYKRKK